MYASNLLTFEHALCKHNYARLVIYGGDLLKISQDHNLCTIMRSFARVQKVMRNEGRLCCLMSLSIQLGLLVDKKCGVARFVLM